MIFWITVAACASLYAGNRIAGIWYDEIETGWDND
jgi:hypothetical protein